MNAMQELYERVARDPSLQAKFETLIKNGEADGPLEKMERILSFGEELGYQVTAQEVEPFFEQLAIQSEGELSDAQLDQVAGGKSTKGVGAIAMSVISIGIVCIVESIKQQNNNDKLRPPDDSNCGQMYE